MYSSRSGWWRVMNGSSMRVDLAGVGQAGGGVDLDHLAVGLQHAVAHEGAVTSSSRLYSRSSRSWTISMCRSPRKPQRNPKPSAAEVSGS